MDKCIVRETTCPGHNLGHPDAERLPSSRQPQAAVWACRVGTAHQNPLHVGALCFSVGSAHPTYSLLPVVNGLPVEFLDRLKSFYHNILRLYSPDSAALLFDL